MWMKLRGVAFGLAILPCLIVASCHKKHAAQPVAPPAQEDNVAGNVTRGAQERNVQNDLKQLATFYNQYTAENGQGPTQEQLASYIQRDSPGIYKSVTEGRYVVIPGLSSASQRVLAYEKDADLNGNRLVAFGDATVRLMTEQDFQAALHNKGG